MLLPSQNGIAADTYSGVNRPRPTRRAFLAGSIGGASALALTGCSGDIVPHGALTLRFWNGFTGPDGRTMLGLVKRFNEQNPDVHVVMQRMEWGTYYNKLFVANLGLADAAMMAGEALGIDKGNLVELLKASSGRSFAFDVRARMESPAGFRHGGTLLRKDIGLLGEVLGADHPAARRLADAAEGFLVAAAGLAQAS